MYKDSDSDDTNNPCSYQVYKQPEDGKEGPQGPEGPEGPEGPQGPQGDKGEDGVAGKNAIDYYIVSEKTQIVFDIKTEKFKPETITCRFYMQEGSNPPTLLNNGAFSYEISNGSYTQAYAMNTNGETQINIKDFADGTTSNITITLYDTEANLLDTETINIHKDNIIPYVQNGE